MNHIINGRRLGWLAAAAVAILGVTLAVSAVSRPAAAQEAGGAMEPTISVSGSGQVFGAPDVAYVSLGVDQMDANVGTAVENARATLASIVAAVQALGVAPEDVQTNNFFVYPEDRYDAQTGQPTGERVYRVQMAVSITVRAIDSVGDVITAGLTAGANRVDSLNFGIADTSAFESQARTRAIENARARAQELADGFGVTLGDPIVISEGVASVPPPIPLANGRVAMADMAGGAQQINPGQLSVTVQLSVVFGIGEG